MDKEQKEHLEFIKLAEAENNKVFEKMAPNMANEYNPKYVQAVKGTELEKLDSNDKQKLLKNLLSLYGNRYHAFRDAWVNLFGSSKATPFKQSPKSVLDEFMNDAMNAKKSAFKNDYPIKWLTKKYAKEMKLIRDKSIRG